MDKTSFFHCSIDNIYRTFNQTFLVSIFNTEHKFSICVFCN